MASDLFRFSQYFSIQLGASAAGSGDNQQVYIFLPKSVLPNFHTFDGCGMKIDLWPLAVLVVTGFTLFSLSTAQTKSPNKGGELPEPIQPYYGESKYIPFECYKRWMGEPSFMMWLMLIMKREQPQDKPSERWDLGTGSLISRRHVLTSCYPVLIFEQQQQLSLIDVIPAFNHYANVKPSGENGTFPWAERDLPAGQSHSCNPHAHFSVVSTIAPRGCNIDFANDPYRTFLFNATANNFLILALAQEIPLKSANSQYMPFDFDIDRNLGLVRWFQSFRKARCVIPRWVPSPGGKSSSKDHNPKIEQQGFTYRSLPFEQKCLVELCTKYCEGNQDFHNCYENCTQKTGRTYHGKLLCLKRMNENIQEPDKYSTVMDVDDVHTPFPDKETCRKV